MGTLGPAAIVVVAFPFSDLSGTKLRPAIVLAGAGHGDWILCQITSNPHSDAAAVKIVSTDLIAGTLAKVSFARPSKLFTAHDTLIAKQVAVLSDEVFDESSAHYDRRFPCCLET